MPIRLFQVAVSGRGAGSSDPKMLWFAETTGLAGGAYENFIRESGFRPQLVERSLPFVDDPRHGVRTQAESSSPTA